MKALLRKLPGSEPMTTIVITGSKSESNRLLLLQAIFPNLRIQNLSESDDTVVLKQGLNTESGIVDVHHAGTAMRFLTAYFAAKEGERVVLSGSDRMHQRPIKVLVDALVSIGAEIEYLEENNYPPIRIYGRKLKGGIVKVQANISSQYISALMLIAPSLPNGLTIILDGKITSVPYIEMTLSLLKKIGVKCSFITNTIKIEPKSEIGDISLVVESDWSSASYFYSLVALSDHVSVKLTSFSEDSLQGDAALVSIYESLGIETIFNRIESSITLQKRDCTLPVLLSLDLSNTPDIAQTIAVSCFGLGIECELTGLHTLKIKETDRLLALKTELKKLGATIRVNNDALYLESTVENQAPNVTNEIISINTYQDHRMAMAFAPLSMKFPIAINDPMVVTKSFPGYWEDVAKLGVQIDFK